MGGDLQLQKLGEEGAIAHHEMPRGRSIPSWPSLTATKPSCAFGQSLPESITHAYLETREQHISQRQRLYASSKPDCQLYLF